MSQIKKSPTVSVILTVQDGQDWERAVNSVRGQSFQDWELVVVCNDDTEDTKYSSEKLATADSRIRLFSTQGNLSQGAAWNVALKNARGDWIAYLSESDEFYPDYLANVVKYQAEGDILFFLHDRFVSRKDGTSTVTTWDPRRYQQDIFLISLSIPLGVAHPRCWIDRVGMFNELLWREAEGEYWRRFARAGATFAYLPLKSGRYIEKNVGSASSVRIPPEQQKLLEDNWRQGKPLYGDSPSRKPIRKLVFVSTHCAIDFASGAAISTVRMLRFLNELGLDCQVFCSSRRDGPDDRPLTELLAAQGEPLCKTLDIHIGQHAGRMIFTSQGNVPVTVFETAANHGPWQSQAEMAAFLKAADHFLKTNRPEAVMTYGGDPVSQELLRVLRRYDIPIVFALRNFSYFGAELFHAVDYILVPSEFSRNYYWEKLGLVSHVLPNVLEMESIRGPKRNPQYVTFINPQEAKGLYVFARIARELAHRRPDIPLLVVEGREGNSILQRSDLGLSDLPSLRTMPNTPHPREFYDITKVMLVPSLCNESFGLAAAEALSCGIPVLASNRGSLPEIVGEGGFLCDISQKYSPHTATMPTAEEVAPWLNTIIRLWDDAEFYIESNDRALAQAQKWQSSELTLRFEEFFSTIFRQPGPPVVLRQFQL